jgi:hypothetical protein
MNTGRLPLSRLSATTLFEQAAEHTYLGGGQPLNPSAGAESRAHATRLTARNVAGADRALRFIDQASRRAPAHGGRSR